jgi:translation elongation factor EF-G
MVGLQLNISLTAREVNAKDPRGTLQTIFQRWIPLSEAVLKMVVRNIPDPRSAQKRKMATLFAPSEEDTLSDQDIGIYHAYIYAETNIFVSLRLLIIYAYLYLFPSV